VVKSIEKKSDEKPIKNNQIKSIEKTKDVKKTDDKVEVKNKKT